MVTWGDFTSCIDKQGFLYYCLNNSYWALSSEQLLGTSFPVCRAPIKAQLPFISPACFPLLCSHPLVSLNKFPRNYNKTLPKYKNHPGGGCCSIGLDCSAAGKGHPAWWGSWQELVWAGLGLTLHGLLLEVKFATLWNNSRS